MKKFSLPFLFLVLFSFVPGFLQQIYAAEPAKRAVPPPVFSVSPTSLDFGGVNTGTTKADSVTVTNTGTSSLSIFSVSSDNADFTVTPKNATIAAAASRNFIITFAPYTPGLKTARIVFAHSPGNSYDTVIVQGTGTGTALLPVFFVNPALLSFGDVVNGKTKRDSVVIQNTGVAPLVLTNVTSSLAAFTATPKSGTLAPNATMKVYVTFAPIMGGPYNAYISFLHNAGAGRDSIPVSGNGTGPNYIPVSSIAPASIAFGDVTNGQTKRDSVIITNTGQTTLAIIGASSSNSVFTVSPKNGTLAPNATLKVYVTFAPILAGSYTAYIRFPNNTPDGKDSIEVTGTGIGPDYLPYFNSTPVALDFGDVVNGNSRKDSVTITNNGVAPLNITNITSGNAVFTVTPKNGALAASASMKVYVTFAPLISGPYATFIRFTDNSTGGKDSIQVSGNGTGTSLEPQFSIAPASLAFDSLRTGTTKQDSVTVTNTGTASLVISNVTSTSNQFTVTPANATIAAAAKKVFYVTFRPTTAGTKQGFINFVHNAQTKKDSIPVSGSAFGTAPVAIFHAAPDTLDFGTVQNGTSKKDSITVFNDGDANLPILFVQSTNAFFTVTPANATIAPDSSKKFYITFSPLSDSLKTGYILFMESVSRTDTVYVNGTGTGGSVAPLFTCAPTFLNFDTCTTGMQRADSVLIKNTGTAPLTVSNVTSSNAYFAVAPTNFQLAPEASRYVKITFAPLAPGLDTTRIIFRHNAASARDTIMAAGQGIGAALAPAFTANTRLIDFGSVTQGGNKQDSVLVMNTGTAALNITRVTVAAPFTVTPALATIPPSGSQEFVVTFSPTSVGSFKQNLVFQHNASPNRDTVLVVGDGDSGSNGPFFVDAPKTLAFGIVATNSSKIDSVIVHNGGRQDLVISYALSSSAFFTVTPQFATVPPAESQTFLVTFSPSDTVARNATLIFSHNALSSPDTVTMSGKGMQELSIQAVRNIANGSDALFTGVVTRAEGSWTRIQDGSGAITIREASGAAFFTAVANGEIKMGDVLRVHGKVSELNDLKAVSGTDMTSYERISRGNQLPIPVKLTLAQIAASGENYESQLITVKKIIITSGGDLTFKASKSYAITDASDASHAVTLQIPNAADSDADGLPLNNPADFYGVLCQSSVTSPTIGYQLLPILTTDLVASVDAVDGYGSLPSEYTLEANYPNPFNPSTTIAYAIPKDGRIALHVFDLYGREVATLESGFRHAGRYNVAFSAKDLPSGVYLYRLEADGAQIVKLMTLMK